MDFSEELGKTPAKAQRPSASEKANPTLKSSIKVSVFVKSLAPAECCCSSMQIFNKK
jgi:hypothetical protein